MAKTDKEGNKKYELMLILKSTLPDAQRKTVLTKIQEQLKQMGGSVEEENSWGKRLLSYPIEKQGEGYYIVYNITLPSTETNEFKRQLNLTGDVLRYLLRQVDAFEMISVPTHASSKDTK